MSGKNPQVDRNKNSNGSIVDAMTQVAQNTLPETLGPIPKQTLAEQVVVILKRYILAEDLRGGHRLPTEREMAGIFGVSRRVIREAMSILEGEEVLTREHGRGIFVSASWRKRLRDGLAASFPTPYEPQDLYSVRCAIEVGAVGVAVENATDEDFSQLEEIIGTMESKARQGKPLIDEEIRFHLCLLRATHSEILQQMDYLLVEGIRLKMYDKPSRLSQGDAPTEAILEHRSLVDALRRRDGSRAVLEMYNHLRKYLARNGAASIPAGPQ